MMYVYIYIYIHTDLIFGGVAYIYIYVNIYVCVQNGACGEGHSWRAKVEVFARALQRIQSPFFLSCSKDENYTYNIFGPKVKEQDLSLYTRTHLPYGHN